MHDMITYKIPTCNTIHIRPRQVWSLPCLSPAAVCARIVGVLDACTTVTEGSWRMGREAAVAECDTRDIFMSTRVNVCARNQSIEIPNSFDSQLPLPNNGSPRTWDTK